MKKKEREKLEAIEYLQTLGIKEGDTIYCILRSVSKSGMNRKISVIYKDRDISYHVSKVIDYKCVEKFGHQALNVSGCGMDMGFSVVYNLSYALFAKIKQTDPGYALKSAWL